MRARRAAAARFAAASVRSIASVAASAPNTAAHVADEVVRRWLARVIEAGTLEDAAELPLTVLAEGLPGLVRDVLVHAEPGAPPIGPAEARAFATRLADLRAGRAQLAGDLALLQGALTEVLARPPAFAGDVAARVARVVAALQAGATADPRGAGAPARSAAPAGEPELHAELERLIGVHERYGRPFALLALDVEGLRRITDSAGPDAGDEVLAHVAARLRSGVRHVDTLFRLEGGEFAVVAPEQSVSGGRRLADRLVTATPKISGDTPAAGLAAGVVACPQHATEAADLRAAADEALLRAKAAGRSVLVGTMRRAQDTGDRR